MQQWFLMTKKADFMELAKQHGTDPLLIRLMINRNVAEEDMGIYLKGTMEDLSSPYLMKDIEKAVRMIEEAGEKKEKITIASDYDVDGLFGGYSLYRAFEMLGIQSRIDTPDRIREGYGLNRRMIEDAVREGSGLLITCDNGIAAHDAVVYGKEKGLKVIVTDHHEVPYEETDGIRSYRLPEADAVVNPKQEDCAYPFKHLCGTAVVYRLIEVLFERNGIGREALEEFIEYTAIATVADVMDLAGENRIIVKTGLKMLENTKNKGLRALIDACGLEGKMISTYHIGFVLAPCFNAAGRLKEIKMARELLMEQDMEQAVFRAEELKRLNDERKQMTEEGVKQAVAMVEKRENATGHNQYVGEQILSVYLENLHESIAGIVAGRLKEYFCRPAFVFAPAEEGIKGSGRSVECYHMFDGLVKCEDLLERFGGHPMAAGLSMKTENYELFKQRINEQSGLTEADLIEKVKIDAAMPFSYITTNLIEEFSRLEPFGKGNEKPLFAQKNVKFLEAGILGKNKNVLKFLLENEEGIRLEAVYFGEVDAFTEYVTDKFGEKEADALFRGKENKVTMSVTYYPDINEFRGKTSIQLVIKHYK